MERDSRFKVTTLAATPNPQRLCMLAAHQDYSEYYVADEDYWMNLSEKEAGDMIIKRCVKFHHWGVTEHPQITLAVGGFPHSVMAQARTHRISSFDVQSGRYTSERFVKVATHKLQVEDVFYFRPVGFYTNRHGKKYEYTEEMRQDDIVKTLRLCYDYANKLEFDDMAPEHARDMLPYNFRQNFVCSFNARSLMHFLDMRAKKDAQGEIVILAEMMFEEFSNWMPEVAAYYEEKRLGKNKLTP